MKVGSTPCTKIIMEVKLGETLFLTLCKNAHIRYEKFTLWNKMQTILKIPKINIYKVKKQTRNE